MKKATEKKYKIHFIGIGGIGVSALAGYYLKIGWEVSGSDLVSSEIIESLKKAGARIFIGNHKPDNVPENLDLLIYSPAVTKNNPELKRATKLKIKSQSYPEALGELTKRYFTVAVCGTHGKSTTTAMIGLLLTRAGFDPTVIVGTKLKEFGNLNYRIGKSQYLVIEADEHFASFLNYWPKIIVLTCLDVDHLDYYKNFKNYLLAFENFVSHLGSDGILVANKNDKNIYSKFSVLGKKIRYYFGEQKESEKLRKILKIPGKHNVLNALAALTVARILRIPDKVSFKTLSEYHGAWRRFEEKELKIENFLGDFKRRKKFFISKLKIINDYAHHPTEIKATLEGAREKYPQKKIFLVYQPHQYQRTYYLFNDFVNVFRELPADEIIITDIYSVAGRENKEMKKKVNSNKLVKKISKESVIYLPKSKILKYFKKNLEGGEVIIIMGAGDIYELSKQFFSR